MHINKLTSNFIIVLFIYKMKDPHNSKTLIFIYMYTYCLLAVINCPITLCNKVSAKIILTFSLPLLCLFGNCYIYSNVSVTLLIKQFSSDIPLVSFSMK